MVGLDVQAPIGNHVCRILAELHVLRQRTFTESDDFVFLCDIASKQFPVLPHMNSVQMMASRSFGKREGCFVLPATTIHNTRWIPPRKLLSKKTPAAAWPLRWTVDVPGKGSVLIIPDVVLGFDVDGSSSRIFLLTVDYGHLPVDSENGDSLFLRTRALVAAARNQPDVKLKPAQVFVAWILRNVERQNELRKLAEGLDEPRIIFVQESEFSATDNVLLLSWQFADGLRQTLL